MYRKKAKWLWVLRVSQISSIKRKKHIHTDRLITLALKTTPLLHSIVDCHPYLGFHWVLAYPSSLAFWVSFVIIRERERERERERVVEGTREGLLQKFWRAATVTINDFHLGGDVGSSLSDPSNHSCYLINKNQYISLLLFKLSFVCCFWGIWKWLSSLAYITFSFCAWAKEETDLSHMTRSFTVSTYFDHCLLSFLLSFGACSDSDFLFSLLKTHEMST